MFKLKMIKKPILFKLKCDFTFPPIVLANMQEKEAIPTKEQQEIVPDKNYDGLSKVTVQKIPAQYIIPSGNIQITENGTYDITSKESVNVDVQPNLQIKSATPTTSSQNITADEGYNGLSSVSISAVDSSIDSNIVSSNIKNGVSILGVTGTLNEGITPSGELAITENGTYDVTNYASANVNVEGSGGADLSDYFKDTISSSGSTSVGGWQNVILKLKSPLVVKGSSANNMFYGWNNEIPELNISSLKSMSNMFYNCGTKNIDISSYDVSKITNITNMFGVSGAETINIDNFHQPQITNLSRLLWLCRQLKRLILGNFNCSNVIRATEIFTNVASLTTIEGSFNYLGKAYETTQEANYSYYSLDLSPCTLLTEQSLINMLNGLYDIATKGCNVQSIVLGSTNLAKLTSEEGQQALTQAQNYGWTIS